MQHPPAKFSAALLLVLVLFSGFTVAWQNPPPLAISAAVDPATTAGQTVAIALTVANTGDAPLEDVVIEHIEILRVEDETPEAPETASPEATM